MGGPVGIAEFLVTRAGEAMKTFALSLCSMAVCAFLAGAAKADETKPGRDKTRLEKFDTNKDGKLDDAEKEKAGLAAGNRTRNRDASKNRRAQAEARLLERFDANKNGKLDDDEKAKAQEERSKNRAERGKPGESREKRMLARFDANGDGKLDAAEQAKAKEERAKNRPARPEGKKRPEKA